MFKPAEVLRRVDRDVEVYRIEHAETREGPYGGSPISYALANDHAEESHPSPAEDRIVYHVWDVPREWYCALTTREGLLEWFEGWTDRLHENGFVLARYLVDADEVYPGRVQLMFNKGAAVHLGDEPIPHTPTMRERLSSVASSYLGSYVLSGRPEQFLAAGPLFS
jgi:hypothetical protein